MERILRSLIQVGAVPDAEDCLRNWIKLQEHSIDFPTVEDKSIFEYLGTFYGQMSAPPDFTIVREFFEKEDNVEAVSRLDEIKAAQPFIGTNYLAIVRAEEDRQQIKNFVMLMRDATVVAEHGRNVDKSLGGKKVLKGISDAVGFVYDKLHDFTRVEGGEKLEGVVTDDAEELLGEYEVTEKTDKYAGRNLFGLEPVDAVCRGHRRGEYWIHTAYAGELKTSLSLNYAYNNAYVYGKNIFYAILEMPYKQLRRQLYVIHSSHGKFVTEWWKEDERLGIPPEHRYTGLDYRKVRDGELSPKDKERLKMVAQDFKTTSKGKLFVWRPSEEVGILEIRRKAEMFHNKWGCDGIVVDHLGLAKPRYRTSDFVTSSNAVVRDGRLMALNFARGRGVPVLALFQMNRQGKLRADKNDGRYDMAAISYANECCAEGTLVQTQLGLLPIEQVEPGVHRVWSSTGWKGVLNRFDNGVRDVYTVETADGAAAKFTGEHKLRALRGGKVVWVQVSDLIPGDVLLSDFDNGQFPLDPPLLPALDTCKYERPTNHDGETLTVPSRLGAGLAYRMGVGLDRKPGIPAVVLAAPKAMVVAYLQGLFDTDGSINSQGVISIDLKRDMKRTLLHAKLLLAKLGVASTVHDSVTRLAGCDFDRTVLRVRARLSREMFARIVGFTEPEKQVKLMSFVHAAAGSPKAGDFVSWPVTDMLERVCSRHIACLPRKLQHAIKTRRVSHGALMQLVNLLRDVCDNDDLDCLRVLASACRPAVVKSVVADGQSQVFDLEVTGDHEYSTDGFLSHNCEKSADVITWTYLNDQLRKEGKFYMGNLKNRDNPLFDRMTGKILWLSKRMRAIESGLIDINNDLLVSAGRHVSQLSASDLLI